MRTSFRVGRVGQTEIRLHISLVLILPYVFFQFRPESVRELAWSLTLLAILFGCILLHEIGHTLVARRAGIHVQTILLWPLGGIAALDRSPAKPLDALFIALAGPLVNLLLGVGLVSWAYGLMYGERILATDLFLTGIWHTAAVQFPLTLGVSNLILAIFNLIPIYPLDGGQVVRSGLHLVIGRQRADHLTLLIAVPLAIGLALFGLWQGDYLLVLISLLLVLGASTLNARLLRHISTGYTALANRGAYYQIKGDFDRAVWHFTRALERHPRRSSLYTGRAVAWIHLQQFERAQEDVESALQEDAENLLAILLRAELYSLEDRLDLAWEWCERASQLRPELSWPHIDLGAIYLKQGKLEEALASLNRAIDLTPHSFLAHILRAIARFQIGDREGAWADQESAFQMSPKEALVYPEFFLPSLNGYLDWALQYYAWALQRLPHSPYPYHGRADALRANSQWQQAVSDYSEAIRLAPGEAALYLSRGLALYASGDRTSAAEDYRQAEQLGSKAHLRRLASELLRALELESGAGKVGPGSRVKLTELSIDG
jgi:Zn-dependent protease/Tfp pilus assembly protein PilF